jgi:CRP-like cAMP-binding protein
MAKRTPTPFARENWLLAALPKEERNRITPDLDEVSFQLKETVYRRNGSIDHVYFPKNGVFSMIILMEDGATIEVGTVGQEGMLGVPAFLGAGKSPAQVFCQVPSEAFRLSVKKFKELVQGEGPLRELVLKYTQSLLNQISQSAACNHLHSIEERMARWLLMTQDRVGADEFSFTQEFLAEMLGTRRATVTVVAGMLQKAGLIGYRWGTITILDRRGLEEVACECYKVVKDELKRLIV